MAETKTKKVEHNELITDQLKIASNHAEGIVFVLTFCNLCQLSIKMESS